MSTPHQKSLFEKHLWPVLFTLLAGGGIIGYLNYFHIRPCPKSKTIEGFVKLESKGPLTGVMVEIANSTAGQARRTDENGRFLLENVRKADSLALKLSYKGQSFSFVRAVDFCGGGDVPQVEVIVLADSLVMKPKPPNSKPDRSSLPNPDSIDSQIFFAGYVSEKVTQKPIVGVLVIGPYGLTASTNERGYFEARKAVKQLPEQDFELTFRAEGYGTEVKTYYKPYKTDISITLHKTQ
jgi:hypothetical protein